MRLVILAWISILFFISPVFAATLYMGSGESYTTLESAVAAMSGGDTLIIRDGTYSGADNVLDQSHMPPSGSEGAPTIICAENDGGAVFTDGFINMTNVATVTRVDFIGLKATAPTIVADNTSYFRFLRCSFSSTNAGQTDDSTFGVSGTYHLIEDCWSWGEGRYGMYARNGAQYIVFRRCVTRLDKINAYSPMAPFQSYSAPDVVFQNCIVLDGNEMFWLDYEERAGAFYSRTAGPVTIEGSIALNYPSYFAGGTIANGLTIKNSVAWNIGSGLLGDLKIDTDATFSCDHLTIGDADGFDDPVTEQELCRGFAIVSKNGTEDCNVTNSIFYDIRTSTSSRDSAALDGAHTISNYNVLYNNDDDYQSTSAGVNDYCADNSNAVNPLSGALEYLPRIEDGSALDGTGSSSSDRGATILYKIGVAGTCYGDTDWDTVTNDDLWPWPYEDRIKTDMASYSYTGVDRDGTPNQTLSGARGFAAAGKQLNGVDDITLTSYIWEYLGNEIPSDIYGVTPNIQGCTITGGTIQ